MTDLRNYLDQGSDRGKAAAAMERDGRKYGHLYDDNIHHIGDDTGKVVTRAYRELGAEAAADVIDRYRDALNAGRRADGIAELSPEHTIKNLGFAFPGPGLTTAEQDDVSAAFRQRH